MIFAFTGAGISKASGIQTFQDRPEIRDCLTRTFANKHPEKYREIMREFVDSVSGKVPNDAHLALAEYKIPVITMNVDTLHEQAGTTELIKIHGRLPLVEELDYCDKLYNTPVLYGDPAPMYTEALNFIYDKVKRGDICLIIGASNYTNFSARIRYDLQFMGVKIIEIQENAEEEVRKIIKQLLEKGEN